MDLDAITPRLVERMLRDWQQGRPTSNEWLALDLLHTYSGSPAERLEQFRGVITERISERLNHYRQVVGVQVNKTPPNSRAALIQCVQSDFEPENSALEAWSALYYRFIEDDFALDVHVLTQQAHVSEKLFRRRVEMALNALTRLIRRLEMETHRALQNAQWRSLVPGATPHLFGSTVPRDEIGRLLLDPMGPRLISIEGIGGIGKTTLAQSVIERIAEQSAFHDLIWIRARQEWLPEVGRLDQVSAPARSLEDILNRLAQRLGVEGIESASIADRLERLGPRLATLPYLIVIDNLETLEDSQALVPALLRLSGESRFLLTSRSSLCQFSGVYVVPVDELCAADSRLLLEAELNRTDRKRRLPPEDASEIYEVVGGIPLALKFIAAQLRHLPFDEVLGEVRQARQTDAETMFRYIYRRLWYLLSEPAQRLLMALCDMAPEGSDLTWIRTLALGSGLSPDQLAGSLAELHDFSLLEINHGFRDPHYRLHRLTITFLRTDMLQVL